MLQYLENKKVTDFDKFVLIALFNLKYENSENGRDLEKYLYHLDSQYKEVYYKLMKKCRNDQRVSKTFSGNFGEKAFQIYKDFFAEIPNIYELHIPYIVHVVENCLKGKLGEDELPFIDAAPLRDVPRNIMVYIIGGATFAEAKHFADLNKKYHDHLFVLGANSLINSKMFLKTYVGAQIN